MGEILLKLKKNNSKFLLSIWNIITYTYNNNKQNVKCTIDLSCYYAIKI